MRFAYPLSNLVVAQAIFIGNDYADSDIPVYVLKLNLDIYKRSTSWYLSGLVLGSIFGTPLTSQDESNVDVKPMTLLNIAGFYKAIPLLM